MQTVGQSNFSYYPRQELFSQSANNGVSAQIVKPMTMENFAPVNVEPPPSTQSATPKQINTSLDDIETIDTKIANNIPRSVFWVVTGLTLAGAAIACIVLTSHFAVIVRKTTTATNDVSTVSTTNIGGVSSASTTNIGGVSSASTTNIGGVSSASTTNIGGVFTATTIITTSGVTTASCVSPYALTSMGTCVNVLIDMNNCGSVGNACTSNYTSCSAGRCSTAPGVQVTNSSYIWTGGISGSIDDQFFSVSLPFSITLYNNTVSSASVATNGVICLGSCSTAYSETSLPAATFPGTTAFIYWDDLYIYAGTSQGMYYAAQGNSPNRTLVFEFYTGHFSSNTRYYRFQAIFFEDQPNIVQYRYFEASDQGLSCTVGVQASQFGPAIQYAYHVANSVTANMSVTFDTTRGTYTNSTF